MFQNSEELLKYVKDEGIEMVDVRFCDLPGIMQHFTVPVSSFDQSVFDDGLGFDGSSIRGFQAINESDMQLYPDPTTAYIDPFRTAKTLNVNFFIHDPITGEAYSRDPRNIARKALRVPRQHWHRRHGVLRLRGRVLHLRLGAVLHRRQRRLLPHRLGRGLVELRPGELRQPRLQDPPQGWLLPGRALRPLLATCAPRWSRTSSSAASRSSRAHHEVGTAGQAEINYRFDTLLKGRRRRDEVQVPRQEHRLAGNGKSVTFMPKPIFGDNGSGMHVHQSIWNEGDPAVLRRDRLRRALRHRPLVHRRHPQARAVAAGLHQPDGELLPPPGAGLRGPDLAGLLLAQPLRLGPDPDHRLEPEGQADRDPVPGPVGQPLPRLLRADAGRLDGIQNKIEPADPVDKDIYELPPDEMAEIDQVPTSLEVRCSTALEADHEFLTAWATCSPPT